VKDLVISNANVRLHKPTPDK